MTFLQAFFLLISLQVITEVNGSCDQKPFTVKNYNDMVQELKKPPREFICTDAPIEIHCEKSMVKGLSMLLSALQVSYSTVKIKNINCDNMIFLESLKIFMNVYVKEEPALSIDEDKAVFSSYFQNKTDLRMIMSVDSGCTGTGSSWKKEVKNVVVSKDVCRDTSEERLKEISGKFHYVSTVCFGMTLSIIIFISVMHCYRVVNFEQADKRRMREWEIDDRPRNAYSRNTPKKGVRTVPSETTADMRKEKTEQTSEVNVSYAEKQEESQVFLAPVTAGAAATAMAPVTSRGKERQQRTSGKSTPQMSLKKTQSSVEDPAPSTKNQQKVGEPDKTQSSRSNKEKP
ncbi:unnamed protein product [Caenorhabditis auriculariae]|uniref:Receptor L-domain domain-containing protein n=1 Tax=Caenorhabditis auriculariae TaxID=2777116 RepID=A0A8S1HHD3_9PELO|nr:unnamed protein product [Caenorhabditis auriculariae]